MILDLINYLRNGADIRDVLPGMLFTVIVVLFSLSLHEMSHAYAAYKMGDHTARNLGRLTLNPAKHLDPIGTISMMLFGFGWAKPVPINTRNFKKPKWGTVLTSLAGPLSNILLSFVSLLLFAVFSAFVLKIPSDVLFNPIFGYYGISLLEAEAPLFEKIGVLVAMLLYYFHVLNLYLAVFNLLPIPPLDGSKIFFMFLPSKAYFFVQRYEHIIRIVLFALLFMGYLSVPLTIIGNILGFGMEFIIRLIPGI